MTDRILLVEDEPAISDAVAYTLRSSGYDVDVLADGEQALRRYGDYDLLLLDVMLPGLSGVEVCRRIRAQSPVPIVMLTARGGEVDRVVGLDAGADDYVPKPFSMPELVSRVSAILRRRTLDRKASTAAVREAGSIRIDLIDQTVRVDGRLIDVTPSEFRLLAVLASEPGRVFTRRELSERLWRDARRGERGWDVHVKNLRRKIEHDPARPSLLVTVQGVGYMLRPG
jgi:two-component system response regulator RegX3